jgi:hypothetical protein
MATPDEVRASLLASGDHGRDGCARRKLADQVKVVVADAADRVGAVVAGQCNTMIDSVRPLPPRDRSAIDAALSDVALAASAVVLASDLRAPAETRAEFLRRLADDVKAGKATMVNAGDSPFRVPSGSPNRQGWRARLASVERLLAASLDSKTPRQAAETVADALAEVRAMIDGEDE